MAAFTEIAEKALWHARKLDAFVASLEEPSEDSREDVLKDCPIEIQDEKNALVDASQDLKRMALGPMGSLLEILFTFTDLQSLRFIYSQNIPSLVPAKGEVSFTELAKSAGIDETLLKRFLQHAMVNGLFIESSPGSVRHTATSRLLREEPGAMHTVGFLVEDLAPSALKVAEAHRKWPASEEPNETGFNIENHSDDSFYAELAKESERAKRFGEGMRFMTKGSIHDIGHLIHGYDWASLNQASATIVDVGGGHGSVSIALARAYPNLRFIVQDLAGTVREGCQQLESELAGRVTYMAHDFFSPQ